MKTETSPTTVSRREVLTHSLLVGLGLSVAPAEAAPFSKPTEKAEFVPENDYPFFGHELTTIE